jgi:hypothetical protein
MKSAFSYITLLLFVLISSQVVVYGQDGPDNEHPVYEDKVYNEAPVVDVDGDSDNKVLTPVTKSSVAKDSSSVKFSLPAQRSANKSNQEVTKENKPQAQQAQSGDDSILSFNFIYYIIQRFKLQDIIE